ncbi:MAG: hypothetical protein K5873_06085, partial [Treponema sp.]|nr:hypothetical protein [Treponema sp.]
MTYFNKKTSDIIVVLSALFLLLSALLILFSNELVDLMYYILSEKVFHRDFSLEKWLPSILSFTQIPAFIVITADVLLFIKLP